MENSVAIVGLGCRLPGADCGEAFFQLMLDRQDTVRCFPMQRRADLGHICDDLPDLEAAHPFYTGSWFDRIDEFDANFFGMTPTEALNVEPEQRMFLESVYQLFEDAGYAASIKGSSTGVYVGHTVNKYRYLLTENHPSASHGNHPPFIGGRVSYLFDLGGPGMMVAAGCSSSLLAVHVAAQAVRAGECDMAVAGGITLDLLPINSASDIWNQLGITGPMVRCRAFDAKANGIAKGEGLGAVLLKGLPGARHRGDHVYAALSSVATHDGHSNGITAPNPSAQTRMLCRAWKHAGVRPEDLGYIEAHGTGTLLGDPIEVKGLTDAFREAGVYEARVCPIGSVKTNIGHLADGAAGIASLAKVLLSLHHSRIPPQLLEELNPHINWQRSPVYVLDHALDWSARRTAGVSCFGLLGTNVHSVVQGADLAPAPGLQRPGPKGSSEARHPLVLAARTERSLKELVVRMHSWLKEHPDCDLPAVCFTINTGRALRGLGHRVVFFAAEPAEMAKLMGRFVDGGNESPGTIGYTAVAIECLQEEECRPECLEDVHAAVLGGYLVDWQAFYTVQNGRVPLLPGYAFERKRFWPVAGPTATLSAHLFKAEHKCVPATGDRPKLGGISNLASQKRGPLLDKIDPDVITAQGMHEESTVVGGVMEQEAGGVPLRALELNGGSGFAKQQAESVGALQKWSQPLTAQCHHPEMGTEVCTPTDPGALVEVLRPRREKEVVLTCILDALSEVFDEDMHYLCKDCFASLYALGMDSLMAVHMMQRLAERLGVTINQSELPHDFSVNSILQLCLSKPSVQSGALALGSLSLNDSATGPQRALWTAQGLDPTQVAYNVGNGLVIRGDLDVARFLAAVNAILQEHFAFRTVLREDAPNTLAQVLLNASPEVQVINMSHRQDPLAAAKQELEASYRLPFDIENGPVVRCVLHKVGSKSFLFSMVVHHLAFDGASHFLFYSDLWRRYSSGDGLEPMASTFSFAAWQRAWTASGDGTSSAAFWRHLMQDAPAATVLPGDRLRPAVLSGVGEVLRFRIPPALLEGLDRLARSSHATLYMVLVASVFVLLRHYSSTTDLVMGTPMAGRPQGFQEVLGCFVNTVPLRLRACKGRFRELLQTVKTLCLQAVDHQWVPFEQILHMAPVEQLFRVNVALQNSEQRGLHVDPPPGLEVQRVLPENHTAKWDLGFDFLCDGDGALASFEHSTDLYSASYMEAMAGCFLVLLEQAVANPAMHVEELAVVPPHHRWHLRAAETPEEVAVIDGDRRVTYNELQHQVAKLSAVLRGTVGVLMRCGTSAVLAVFAALDAHVPYVPLDPCWPRARLLSICSACGVGVLLFTKQHLGTANELQYSADIPHILCLDSLDFMGEVESAEELHLMDADLWDHVAKDADADVIRGGGWKSSYTDEWFSEEEMAEYADNVRTKLSGLVDGKRVLEIGAASGITTRVLAPLAATYTATDLSPEMVARLKGHLPGSPRLGNMVALQAEASEVSVKLVGQTFDVVVLNSVAHCFPGLNYCRRVLRGCADLLSPGGCIFIGDVMDADLRPTLLASLTDYKRRYPSARTKLDWSAELFLHRAFLRDLAATLGAEASFSTKLLGRSNELSEFRFDCLLRLTGQAKPSGKVQLDWMALDKVAMRTGSGPALQRDVAYILFTSGTTGRPLGVKVGHLSLTNYVQCAVKLYSMDRRTVMPLYSALTFDFTLTSLLCPLAAGGKIKVFRSFEESCSVLARDVALTHVKITPGHLDMLLDEAPACRCFIVGGEALSAATLDKLHAMQGTFKLFDEYGPTEATVGCVVKQFDRASFPVLVKTIGQPIAQVEVKIAEDGELLLRGNCMFLGYLGDDVEYRRRMQDGWFRTGDRATMVGGEVQYLGRLQDDIAKVSGVRVDLTEIQSHLVQQPGVTRAAVGVVEGTVAAFFEGCAAPADLRRQLASLLPEVAVPRRLVAVEALQWTSHGKVDFAKLAAQQAREGQSARFSSEPRVCALQKVFQDVLAVNHAPSLDEDFFSDLGGDSIKVVRAVRRLRGLGLEVAPADIFRHRCIRGLLPKVGRACACLESPRGEQTVRPTPIVADFFKEARHPDQYMLPALIRFKRSISEQEVSKAIHCLVGAHPSLRSSFSEVNGQWVQMLAAAAELQSQKIHIDPELPVLTREPKFHAFVADLEGSLSIAGPVATYGLITYGTELWCLLAVHHLVTDVVSWDILLDDLERQLEGHPLEPDNDYIAFCENLSASEFWEERDFWDRVDVEVHRCADPLCGVRTGEAVFRNARMATRTAGSAASLAACAAALGCSTEVLLLDAAGQTFGTPTAVMLEGHGRSLNLSSRAVGWFTARFPFVLGRPNADRTTRVAGVAGDLARTREQGQSFGVLQQYMAADYMEPTAMFVYQGELGQDCGRAGFDEIPWIEIMMDELAAGRHHRHADEVRKFDLEIYAWIFGKELRIGCFYDQSKYSRAAIDTFLETWSSNLFEATKDLTAMLPASTPSVQVICPFNLAPAIPQMKAVFEWFDLPMRVAVCEPHLWRQALQEDASDLRVVVLQADPGISPPDLERGVGTLLLDATSVGQRNEVSDAWRKLCKLKFPYFPGIYDCFADSKHNMPLTTAGYELFGLSLGRAVVGLCRPTAVKVVCVDADYTLFHGEAARGDLAVLPGHAALQKFLQRLRINGLLLCLCSKNNEEDVRAALGHPDMILQPSDFVSVQASWRRKSDSLRLLSAELGLALESFAFLDDSQAECADMVAELPEVLTIHVPAEPKIEAFLFAVWQFDNFQSGTGAARSQWYQQEQARQADLTSRASKADLLAGWRMELFRYSGKLSGELFGRVQELLRRTNQFKLNAEHLDVAKLLESGHTCWCFGLRDRFGSYGVVSAVFFTTRGKTVSVSQWTLSCRALGREVEDAIHMQLVREAPLVAYSLADTGKNQPAREFVTGLAKETCLHQAFDQSDADQFLASCGQDGPLASTGDSEPVLSTGCSVPMVLPDLFKQKNTQFLKVQECFSALTTRRSALEEPLNVKDVVARAWRGFLPSAQGDFFKAGGTSQQAVLLIGDLRRRLKVDVQLVDLLEKPCLNEFADEVERAMRDRSALPDATRPPEESVPLSRAQVRMLFLQALQPTSTAYTESVGLFLPSTVDRAAIREAACRLAEAHSMLQACLVDQRMERATNTTPEIIELGAGSVEEALASLEFHPGRSLSQFLIVTVPGGTVAVLQVDHIIIDSAGLDILASDWKRLIMREAIDPGDTWAAAATALCAEGAYFRSERYEADRHFWQRHLHAAAPVKFPGPSTETGQVLTTLNAQLVENLQSFATQSCCTMFHLLLSAFFILIHRFTNSTDIIVGIPISHRPAEADRCLGLFVNTVAVRISEFDGAAAVRHFVHQVRDTFLQSYQHAAFPFDEVPGASDLITWMINKVEASAFVDEHGIERLLVPSRHPKFAITLDLISTACGEIVAVLEYDKGKVVPSFAAHIADSFKTVLSHISTASCVQDVNYIGDAQLQRLLSFNAPIPTVPERRLVAIFEEHVRSSPERPAVVYGGKRWSYRKLDSFAEGLAAAAFHCEAFRTGVPVLLIMDRDALAVAAALAVWKLGGHFIPVAASLQERVPAILRDAGARLILTNVDLPTVHQATVLDARRCRAAVPSYRRSQPGRAYTIYTSGSTGTPKPIHISDRSLQFMTSAWRHAYGLESFNVNVLQWAAFSFDVFVGDVLRALCCTTGSLTICPEARRLDLDHVAILLASGVSVLEVTPQLALPLFGRGSFPTVRLIVIGSDVVQCSAFRGLREKLIPGQRLVNSYGLTEATIDSSFFEGDPPVTASGITPVGRPLPGVTMHVLGDADLRELPIGVVGQLCIGGPTVGTGDLRKVQTSRGALLLTGDRARWLESGDLEVVGRGDTTLKLRGYRIDTSDIENHLIAAFPSVVSAAVTVIEEQGDQYLCAFVCGAEVSVPEVRAAWQGRLPAYMIPDIVQRVEAMPLSAHGKLDKSKLPLVSEILSQARPHAMTTISESPALQVLSECWYRVMGFPSEPSLSFADQGATSLKLLQFWLRLQDVGIRVEMSDLFSYSSLESLSAWLDGKAVVDVPVKISQSTSRDGVSIVGIGLDLPGSIHDIWQLWAASTRGCETLQDFPAARAEAVLDCMSPHDRERLAAVGTYRGHFFAEVDGFDHKFFQIPPGEARYMAPEQRIVMEMATKALVDAGETSQLVGVFMGTSDIKYDRLIHADESVAIPGISASFLATRISYYHNFTGPSIVVDTTCSSGLVALHHACQTQLRDECDAALAGGVNLVQYPAREGVHGPLGILAKDFRCKAFDAQADGTAVGEGCVCFVLRAAQDLADGDDIYATIKGTAVNSVGHGNGITAPSVVSQENVIRQALTTARLSPEDVAYVETHGTGTKLGDTIEVEALKRVFPSVTLGATKAKFGHLDAASGLLAFAHAVSCVKLGRAPGLRNFVSPLEALRNSGLVATTQPTELPPASATGVSSFGLSGTNCHVVLGCARRTAITTESSREPAVLYLTASPANFRSLVQSFIDFVEFAASTQCFSLHQIANGSIRKLQTRHEARGVVVGQSLDQILEGLGDLAKPSLTLASVGRTGHGQQYIGSALPKAGQCFLLEGVLPVLAKGQETSPVPLCLFESYHHWAPAYSDAIATQPTSKVPATNPPDILSLLRTKLLDTRELVRTLSLATPSDLAQCQLRFCNSLVLHFFRTRSVDLQSFTSFTLDELLKTLGMHERYRRLLYAMLRSLQEEGCLALTGDVYQSTCMDLPEIPAKLAQQYMQRFPIWRDCFAFPLHCAEFYEAVLCGTMSPLSVIYPKGDMDFMTRYNRLGDPLGDVYYNMYMQAIAQHVSSRSSVKPVRILEVGAGVGHVTRQIVPKLSGDVEYWFTDLGKAFVEHAKKKFADYNFMRYAVFDITKPSAPQGLEGHFDVIISYNVIHTTASIRASVGTLVSALSSDGVLFVIESARNETWATLAWGLLDGWWYFSDHDLRPHDVMLEPAQWKTVLESTGLNVATCPAAASEEGDVEKFLFVVTPLDLKSGLEVEGWWEKQASEAKDTQTSPGALQHEVESALDQPPLQTILAQIRLIWADLLGTSAFSDDANFFEIGGESLLAITMIQTVQRKLHADLEIADVFAYSTARKLADFVESKVSTAQPPDSQYPCRPQC